MEVIGWSPNLTPERAASAGVTFISTKEELFRRSDVLSVQIVLSERTQHIIKAADLALLKPTAFFINTSRGPLVDEAALIEVLKEKRIAGAGLDVFDEEPSPLDHPLRKLPNVTISPHMGYVSDDNYGVRGCYIWSMIYVLISSRRSGVKRSRTSLRSWMDAQRALWGRGFDHGLIYRCTS